MNKLFAIGLVIVAMVYSQIETAFFGWNWMPKSSQEVTCDGLAGIMMCVAILAVIIANPHPPTK